MWQEIRKVFKTADKWILAMVFFLAAYGVTMIYSASKTMPGGLKYVSVQLIAFLIGLILMFIMAAIDYESFGNQTKLIYALNILLLATVFFLGTGEEVGTKGWIRFGGIGIQPSEIVKIGFVLTFAKHLERDEEHVNKLVPFIGMVIHAGVLIGMVLLQPDYGTAMVYMFMFICMIFAAGLYYRTIFIAFGGLLAFAPIAWFFILKPYQKERFLTFFNPAHDPSGMGYQVTQSKIAIGSGEVTGRNLFEGPQTQLNILPAKHTDFIFGVIGEELGFIGSIIVIIVLFALVIKCFHTGLGARTNYGRYICIGIGAMFLFQIFENIGMCIGVMPVTGIPLPFISSGGSSLLTNMIAVGIVLSVCARRKMINF